MFAHKSYSGHWLTWLSIFVKFKEDLIEAFFLNVLKSISSLVAVVIKGDQNVTETIPQWYVKYEEAEFDSNSSYFENK